MVADGYADPEAYRLQGHKLGWLSVSFILTATDIFKKP